jgi:hypothetical protein
MSSQFGSVLFESIPPSCELNYSKELTLLLISLYHITGSSSFSVLMELSEFRSNSPAGTRILYVKQYGFACWNPKESIDKHTVGRSDGQTSSATSKQPCMTLKNHARHLSPVCWSSYHVTRVGVRHDLWNHVKVARLTRFV